MGRENLMVTDVRKVSEKPWYTLTAQDVIKTIDSSLQKGLDFKEAKKLIIPKFYGSYDELVEDSHANMKAINMARRSAISREYLSFCSIIIKPNIKIYRCKE